MLFIYSIAAGVLSGTINYLYFRRQGYSSWINLVMSILGFTGIAFVIIKLLH